MQELKRDAGTINFLAKFTSSEQFEKTFHEGMGLVEETANYLDVDGRIDARILDRNGAIAYATESMRLTTRLMQMASWLLLQRAISTGELTSLETTREKQRITLKDIGRGNPLQGAEQLPQGLIDLVERSLRLLERITKLDEALLETTSDQAPSPVNEQHSMLERAFKTA